MSNDETPKLETGKIDGYVGRDLSQWRARDGFIGTLQGEYITREGDRGVVLQQVGTRVVHVYRVASIMPVKPNESEQTR